MNYLGNKQNILSNSNNIQNKGQSDNQWMLLTQYDSSMCHTQAAELCFALDRNTHVPATRYVISWMYYVLFSLLLFIVRTVDASRECEETHTYEYVLLFISTPSKRWNEQSSMYFVLFCYLRVIHVFILHRNHLQYVQNSRSTMIWNFDF